MSEDNTRDLGDAADGDDPTAELAADGGGDAPDRDDLADVAGADVDEASETDDDADAGNAAADDAAGNAAADDAADPAEEDAADDAGNDDDGDDAESVYLKSKRSDSSARRARRERKAAERAAAAAVPEGAVVRTESTRHWGVNLLLAFAVAALVGATASLGYFTYTAVRAYVWEGPATVVRDESVDVAEQTILNILEIDPKDTKGWQQRVQSTLTGDAAQQINDEVVGGLQQQLTQAGQAEAATLRARIARSAVVELDTDEQKAQVLVYAAVTPSGTPESESEGETPMGFVVSVVKKGDDRKVDKIIPISAIVYQEAGN